MHASHLLKMFSTLRKHMAYRNMVLHKDFETIFVWVKLLVGLLNSWRVFTALKLGKLKPLLTK